MKKTLFAAILFVAAISCAKEKEINQENQVKKLGISSENTIFLATDDQHATLAFNRLGGQVTVYVNTDATEWEVKSQGDDFATFTADKAAGTLVISVQKNMEERQRRAECTITAGTLSATLIITQDAFNAPTLVASKNRIHLAAIGQTSDAFTVECSVDDWNFETAGTEWLLVRKEGNTITLEADENKAFTDRAASFILYAGEDEERVTVPISVVQDRKARVTSGSSVVAMRREPTEATEIQLASNFAWNYEVVEGSADWFTIQCEKNQVEAADTVWTLTFTGTENTGDDNRKAIVRFTTGDGAQNVGTLDIVVAQPGADASAFRMGVGYCKVGSNQFYKMVLPFTSGTNVKVDWGDGTVEDLGNVTAAPEHTYPDKKLYDVSIWGNIPNFGVQLNGLYSSHLRHMIKAVYSWGDLGFEKIDFRGCDSLTAVPTDDRGVFANVTHMIQMFEGTDLQEVPENFLKYANKLVSAESMFSGRRSITEVPADFFYNCPELESVKAVFNQTNVASLDKDMFSRNPKLTDMSQLVANDTCITEIPAGIFDHNPEVTTFNAVFSGCTKIKAIPAGLFANQTKVTNFRMAFTSTAVETIPENLFGENYGNTTFLSTFNGTKIKSVPENLFKGFSNVDTFLSCFINCTELETVPVGLFDDIKGNANLNNLFSGCTKLTGESPYTMVNGVKYHLYERTAENAESSGFAAISKHGSTFKGCTGLDDYDAIPANWKN